MPQQRSKERKESRRVSLENLPEDVLCQIIKRLGLYDKIRLQLVSRKLHALLLSPPPGEGLWGECDLSVHFEKFIKKCGYVKPEVRR